MYLSKRNFSTQGIKSLYPKCIDCINFTEKTQTCKKFVTTENYIHHDSSNEFALNVRNDDSKCGKAGNLFDIGKEKLEEDNIHVLNVFCGWTLATSVLAFVTQSFEVIFIPATISFFTGIIYFVDYHDYHKKMNNEKKRLENIKQFHNK
jgi:hypothetical protein